MKKYRELSCALGIVFLSFLSGGRPAWGAGYEFEGVGAREVSRAGAAIADSDDWTAIYWNPGNIVRAAKKNGRQAGLELFGGKVFGKDGNSISGVPGGGLFTRQHISSSYLLGGIGGVLPVGSRGGVGFGFYTPLLQGAKFTDSSAATGTSIDYSSYAGILVWNVSGSYELNPKLSVGAGLDLLFGTFHIKQTLTGPGSTLAGNVKGDGLALEGIFGVRYDAHPKVSLGAVYRTGGDANIKGNATGSLTGLPNESSKFKTQLRHPPTAGVGVSYRPASKWSTELDYNRTFWNRFTNAIQYDNQGLLLRNTGNTFRWEDTWKIRWGAEFQATEKTGYMGGLSYDRGRAVDSNSIDITTSIDTPRLSYALGTSHKWNSRWETVIGTIVGGGRRKEGSVDYKLFGWQLMGEVKLTL